MAFEYLGQSALNYYPCRYGASKIIFRGPEKSLAEVYCAVIGGSETYGKFVDEPFPTLLEKLTGRSIVNLGCMNAGVDAFANDDVIIDICKNAEITIVQLTGAQNMSNKYYTVHPRRNDRFLEASDKLRALYEKVDFTEIHFTGHLLNVLEKSSARHFSCIRKELRIHWVSLMKTMLERIGGNIILLWLSEHDPCDPLRLNHHWGDPVFLNRDMLDQLSGLVAGVVEIVATPDEINAGHERMYFSQMQEPAARQMLGPVVQQAAARELSILLATL